MTQAADFTLAQICADAAAIAKVPGWLAQAGRSLNLVLNDLVHVRDLKMCRLTETITIQAGLNGPYPLTQNYLRTYDMFYFIPTTSAGAGLPVMLFPVGQDDYDAEYKDPSLANYPYEYATDLSGLMANPATPPVVFFYPQSSGQWPVTHRYFVKQPMYASPETDKVTIPWFPLQDYLLHATAARLMRYTDDAREKQFSKDAEEMLRPYLIQEGDEQKVVKQVRLDPRHFRARRNLRPTKVTD